MTANWQRFVQGRAIAAELAIDAALCIPTYCLVTFIQAIQGRGLDASLSLAASILGSAAYFALATLAVRAVTHTPWHFWLRFRAARAHGFSWRRTYGWLAGSYALAYLIGIGATGGVLWESLIDQPVRVVLPSLAACLAAPLVTYKLLGETIDTLAAQARPGAEGER